MSERFGDRPDVLRMRHGGSYYDPLSAGKKIKVPVGNLELDQ
jgi:hypothetical protein